MEIFNILLVNPIINFLVIIYQGLSSLNVPYPLGFSIIILTIIVRLLMSPLIGKQTEISKKMQKVNPHLSRLKDLHKGDSKRLQEETMKLYKEHGINPAAGCVPALIQLPLILALYNVLQQAVSKNSVSVMEHINKVLYFPSLRLSEPWNSSFFGVPLQLSPSELLGTAGIIVFLIPILTGLFQFIQSKLMMPPPGSELAVKKTPGKEDDFATVFQKQSLFLFPAMIGFFSYSLPIGLSLYWNTYTIFGILQQYKQSDWTLQDVKDHLVWTRKDKKK